MGGGVTPMQIVGRRRHNASYFVHDFRTASVGLDGDCSLWTSLLPKQHLAFLLPGRKALPGWK